MVRAFLWGFAIVLALASIAEIAVADDVAAPEEFSQLRNFVSTAVDEHRTPSIALAVVRDGNVVWAEGFGYADIERKVPVTSESIYRLASISKPITATVLMTLVDEGKLDLDKAANAYLPHAKLRAYVGSADAITLRRLANHTSGLQVHYNFFYGRKPYSVDEAIAHYGFAATEPGTAWEYSNLGFGILNYVSEVAAETPWRELMTKRLFQPLEMDHSAAGIPADNASAAVTHYMRDAAGRYVPVEYYEFDHPGGSVICSSAADMMRFSRMHLAGGVLEGVRILSEESAHAMQRATGAERYGIGWFVGRERGRRIIEHSGGMPGVATQLRLFPDDNCAVVVLTNRDSTGLPREVAGRVGRVLFPEDAAPDGASDHTATGSALERFKEPEKPEPPTGRWSGRLVHLDGDIPVAMEFTGNDAVRITLGDSRSRNTTFRIRGDGRLLAGIRAMVRTQSDFHGIPELEFRLTRKDDRLTGVAVAQASGYFALSHWVELTRESASRAAAADE
jgi:CubicO group peptidase (beta-lactamase class C family)